jgi:hypothetical protein
MNRFEGHQKNCQRHGETIVRPPIHVNSFCRAACTRASTGHPARKSIGGTGRLTLKTMLDLLCYRIDLRQHARACRFTGALSNATRNAKDQAPR